MLHQDPPDIHISSQILLFIKNKYAVATIIPNYEKEVDIYKWLATYF